MQIDGHLSVRALLVLGWLILGVGVSRGLANPAPAGQTLLVSAAADGSVADSGSNAPALSADGRFVSFASLASDLVADDDNNARDIFVRDMGSTETWRVSVATNGSESDGDSEKSDISATGGFVVFDSYATNLVANDTNSVADIFWHDVAQGETRRISVASNGAQANGDSLNPAISADGRYVVFHSFADNLVAGDTNGTWDIFRHDTATNNTEIISVATNGTLGNLDSLEADISGDGQRIVFRSAATNLVPGHGGSATNIFLRDLAMGTTVIISTGPGGQPADHSSYEPAISTAGEHIAFWSMAMNLVPGNFNGDEQVFWHDVAAGETRVVSVTAAGTLGNDHSRSPTISGDGMHVAFYSSATNLVPNDNNGWEDVFLHLVDKHWTVRVSGGNDGNEGNWHSGQPALAAAASFVTFSSKADNLVTGDDNLADDVFRHEFVIEIVTKLQLPIMPRR